MPIELSEDEFLHLIDFLPKDQADVIITRHPVKDAIWCSYCCGYRKPHSHIQDKR